MNENDTYYTSQEWKDLRKKALRRDGNRCVYCGDKNNLHVHHIAPRKQGGKDEVFNLITLCATCHTQSHSDINRDGLATIPGPDWEIYRFEITNHDDVMRYADLLDRQGSDGSMLREVEKLRGM